MRRIVNGVRHDGRVYRGGDEGALAQSLEPEQIARLVSLGALIGDWGAEKAEVGTDFLSGYSDVWGAKAVESLRDAGYVSRDSIEDASDSELVALPAIGAATVKRIRETLRG